MKLDVNTRLNLHENVMDEHDKAICNIDKRLAAIEEPIARIKWVLGILVTAIIAVVGTAIGTWLTR